MADGTEAQKRVRKFLSFPLCFQLLDFIIKELYYKKKLKDIAV